VHGTTALADPETGARNALVFAMYHPAAALRTAAIERESFDDVARVPAVLLEARERRTTPAPAEPSPPERSTAEPSPQAPMPSLVAADPAADDASQLTLF
jgi:hypothetical protein